MRQADARAGEHFRRGELVDRTQGGQPGLGQTMGPDFAMGFSCLLERNLGRLKPIYWTHYVDDLRSCGAGRIYRAIGAEWPVIGVRKPAFKEHLLPKRHRTLRYLLNQAEPRLTSCYWRRDRSFDPVKRPQAL